MAPTPKTTQNGEKHAQNRGKHPKSSLGARPNDLTQQVTARNSEAHLMIP
jgi:hypothetical protein